MVPGGDKPNLFKGPQRKMDVLIIRLLMLIGVIAINAIVGFCRGRDIYAGEPLAFGIACSFIIIFLLYEWKNNKVELIKRCILAAPFAPLLIIVFKGLGFDSVLSVCVGILVFLFLVMKTENWKRHFLLTLVMAVIFTVLLTYFKHVDLNVYKVYAIFGLGLPFVIFYTAYLSAMDLQKTIELSPLIAKAIKFTAALFLFFTLFLIFDKLRRHYHIGLAISFIISSLISLCFLGVCYLFKISLSDSSVSNKNNEIKNKKFIDKLKTRFYVFRGEDEKNSKAGKCAFCGRSICSSEMSHAIKGHTVCGQCYQKIEEEKAGIT